MLHTFENTGVEVSAEKPARYLDTYLGWSIWRLPSGTFYVEAEWDAGRGLLADDMVAARKKIWVFWHPEWS